MIGARRCWSRCSARGPCAICGSAAPASCVSTTATAQRRPADRAHHPRDEPHRRHPACLGVRRPRPLLDLPRAHRRRRTAPSAGAARPRSRRCWPASARRPTCGSPASSARRPAATGDAAAAASAGPVEAYRRQPQAHGGERYVAILFADIRGFTAISEGKLPYDVVFLLNRYFRATGQAIEAAGGRLDKFIGDGVMALFGLDSEPQVACRQALDAARRMAAGARRSQRGAVAATSTSRCASASACMPARPSSARWATSAPRILTAIGDTVNIASRLESADQGIRRRAGRLPGTAGPRPASISAPTGHEVDIRGRQGRLAVRASSGRADLTAMS